MIHSCETLTFVYRISDERLCFRPKPDGGYFGPGGDAVCPGVVKIVENDVLLLVNISLRQANLDCCELRKSQNLVKALFYLAGRIDTDHFRGWSHELLCQFKTSGQTKSTHI